MVDLLKMMYADGLIDEAYLNALVLKGRITQEEKQQIINKE